MASFDPSIISQIPDFGPHPAQAKKEAYTLASQMNQNTLQRMQLKDAQTQQADEAKAKEIVKKSKNDTSEDRMRTAERLRTEVGPDYSNKFLREAQGVVSGEYALQLQKLQVAAQQQDSIVGAMDGVISQVDALKAQGATPAMLDAKVVELGTQAMQVQLQQNPELAPAINRWKLDPRFRTYDGWKSGEADSKDGRDRLKTRLEEHKVDIQEQSEKNRERSTDIQQQRADTYEKDKASLDKLREGAVLDSDTAIDMTKQYLAGDKSVLMGLGSGKNGPANVIMMRRAIRIEGERQGLSPADRAARIAAFNGLMAEERAAGARQATIEIASKEAENVFPIVEKASKAVSRGDWVPINKIVQKLEQYQSDPKLGAFAQAIDTTVNVYARAISPTGVPHEAARARALSILSTATGPDDFEAKLNIMKAEINAAKNAPEAVRDEILESFKRGVADPNASPQAPRATAGGATDGKVDLGKGIWNP